MKFQAIKKADGQIWLAHGDASRAMEEGDTLIELPSDWEQPNPKYRNAWTEKDGEIAIDLPKAKEQKLEEIRKARNEKLAESDREWMVAMSKGESVEAINAKKAALRSIPEVAEAALAAKRSINTVDSYDPEWP